MKTIKGNDVKKAFVESRKEFIDFVVDYWDHEKGYSKSHYIEISNIKSIITNLFKTIDNDDEKVSIMDDIIKHMQDDILRKGD